MLNSSGTSKQWQRIAVIGGGAAGMAAAHLLSKRHDVTLIEASSSLGGHAHAETLVDGSGNRFDVDTAFLIFNDKTYGNFLKFIEALGVEGRSVPAEMSSCFSDMDKNFHYALGNGFSPFLARPSALLRPELARILVDLVGFRKRASADLISGRDLDRVTTAEYLAPYSSAFAENFVYPLTAAIWSLPAEKVEEYPVATLLNYFDNHQLLRGKREKRWRTFKGSSSVYVSAFARSFTGGMLLNTPVLGVKREADFVKVHTGFGSLPFDAVVLATHADVSLRLLSNPTKTEQRLLGAWTYQNNPVTLHSDCSVLHEDARLWCSWNMRRQDGAFRVSYYLNRLQMLPCRRPVILTLGDLPLDESMVTKRFNYRHPVYDASTVRTQSQLPYLNGVDRVHFCGSYFGNGFHEDAVRSAAQVAQGFGIDWEVSTPPNPGLIRAK